jgi:phosphohistidine swiveling domain-containing protein
MNVQSSNTTAILPLAASQDVHLVGGKALNLARLITAGFPVPGGFVITTAAYQNVRASHAGNAIPADLALAITDAYRALGEPPVAVRSSATAEDMAGASMAGQYQTILDVRGADALLDAVRRCWSSLDSPRVRSYLLEHQIDPAHVSMAVVVQELVHADVAGVLFTDNPQPGCLNEMLIEASWGLGEAVVSGIVQPDTLTLNQRDGSVKQAVIGDKTIQFVPGSHESSPVPGSKRRQPCLDSRQVHELWQLGWRVRRYFASPQDTEWAFAGDRLYLLQSRAITTLHHADLLPVLLEAEKKILLDATADGRGPWARHNLSETLPQPTPLTWSVMRRFMSGAGGFGNMYRLAGFQPSAMVEQDGFLDLIAGRVYMDLSLASEMFFAGFPFAYDTELLKAHPDTAQNPPTLPTGSLIEKIRCGRRLTAVNRTLEKLAAEFVTRLENEIIPAFTAWVECERSRDLVAMTPHELMDLWDVREHRIMDEFAPQSLLPSLLCAHSIGRLKEFIAVHFHDEDPESLVNLLAGATAPDLTLAATAALHAIAHDKGLRDDWLRTYGHRAPDEFDLATARWHERPAALEALIAPLKGGPSPHELHHRRAEAAQQRILELSATLSTGDLAAFREHLTKVHRHLPWRENGKHHLMTGYQLLRDIALEAGRRLAIEERADVFLLTLPELRTSMGTGFAPLHLIAERRAQRAALAPLNLPAVIDSKSISRLGETLAPEPGSRPNAFAISPGTATGPVRIVFRPEDFQATTPGYVLVCPSTDPSWTPLFVQAAAVIMERGGTLSHGAVVARELGIPAVVVEGATRRYNEGEILTVDGSIGAVRREGETDEYISSEASPQTPETRDQRPDRKLDLTTPYSLFQDSSEVDPLNTRVPPSQLPPAPSTKDRRAARLRNIALIVWGVFLATVFLLPPPWLKLPCFRLLDTLLLPAVDLIGRPALVALMAVFLGFYSMLGQRLFTNNRRLLLAKARAANLRREARTLPPDCPRSRALLAAAAPVQSRVALAALVPLCLILGPMVLSFLWLPERVDPSSWNPAPGTTVHITALVAGDHSGPVTLSAATPLVIDNQTPSAQTLPPIRSILERQLSRWRQAEKPSADLPWELREAARVTRDHTLASLDAFLKQPIPAQTMAWTVQTPKNQPGRFPISLCAEGATPVSTFIVLGNRHGPEPKEDFQDGKGPVQAVIRTVPDQPIQIIRILYNEQKTKGQDVFWKPVDHIHALLGSPVWFAPWLIVYLLVYIPAMFLAKWLFRVP